MPVHSLLWYPAGGIRIFQGRICISPWANGGPHAHTPWSSMSDTILFKGPSEITLAMLPEKRTGTHYY